MDIEFGGGGRGKIANHVGFFTSSVSIFPVFVCFLFFFLVFNVGEYRRFAIRNYEGCDFFDPHNDRAIQLRQ